MVTNAEKWAVVIGGSSGLGLATAKKLASDGYSMVVIHRDSRANIERVEKEFDIIRSATKNFQSFNCDASDAAKTGEVCAALVETCGANSVAVVVHSLAKGSLKPMTGKNSLVADDFMLTINAMAVSYYTWVSTLFRHSLFADDARLVAFTSEGSAKALPNYAAVSAAKAALEAISRSIALEFAAFGLKSNCVQAGITDTPSLRMIPGYERLMESSALRNPQQMLTTPEKVANVVSALCRKEMEWVTGTIIKADGGESLQ